MINLHKLLLQIRSAENQNLYRHYNSFIEPSIKRE